MLTTLVTMYLSAQLNGAPTEIPYTSAIEEIDSGIEVLALSPIPQKKNDAKVYLGASAAMAIDVSSNQVLYEKNADLQLSIASITKIMTAVVVIEEIENLDEIAKVSYKASIQPGSKVWLRSGEKISYRDLLYGLLIQSGNDTAIALAENVAGSEEVFVQKMNEKARMLGMENTSFANPHGLDDPENYSTASDVAILANYALKKKVMRDIIGIKEIQIISESGILHQLHSTNKLLGDDPEVKGFKTGSTLGAGECLVSLAENEFGNEIITIVLNSPERFNESRNLKAHIWQNYVW